ncbi:MAG: UDP-N-acetylglucosamine 2-epimerase (non-hydrolyzing) [Nitrospiraceae bacterium]|nr:UDP-N-acetylglucosamine 2-epimerase (non-hydrolyzing) [Nitrospiraceae bacterium]
MKIHLVCAARPNFMKIAPLFHALRKEDWAEPVIVHTGQHYDPNMSDAFFEDLGLPVPHIHLGIKNGSHAEQTAKVMVAYEKVLLSDRPDLVVVVGDVNSTMAATVTAAKLCVPVAHLEAGLRSFDRSMPEEVNRLVTDALADMLWTPSRDASENLQQEGVPSHKVRLVGNIMIDSLELMREKIESLRAYEDFGLSPENYGVVTLHRPSNVDDPAVLEKLCSILGDIARDLPLVFPVHPRTRKNMEREGLWSGLEQVRNLSLPEPMNYVRFLSLVMSSRFVLTDSGGIQEETSYLGIPCITVRKNTERPVTVTRGTNKLCSLNEVAQRVSEVLRGPVRHHTFIEFWDGNTAGRIVQFLRAAAAKAPTKRQEPEGACSRTVA